MGLFKKNSEIERLRSENKAKDQRIKQLVNLCERKDACFMEVISDGMRHGSPLAAKHMAERREYLKNNRG